MWSCASLPGSASGKCVDVPGRVQTARTGLIIWTCSAKCMDANAFGQGTDDDQLVQRRRQSEMDGRHQRSADERGDLNGAHDVSKEVFPTMPVMVHLARPQKTDSIQRFFNARLISNRRPTPALDGFLNV